MNKSASDYPGQINLVDPALYSEGDPYEVWRWLRINDPVRWHPPTDFPGFWVLTKYEDVRAVYRDPAAFSSAGGILLRPESDGADPGGGRTMALTDPPRHRQLRSLVDEWFAVRAVRGLEPELRSVAHQVVAEAIEHERVDFVSDVAARIPLYVICSMMGVPRTDWEYIFELTSQAFSATDISLQRDAHMNILLYFTDLADARALKPLDDLVSVLANAEIEGSKLTPDELILFCDNLLVGGTENTRIAAAGGMLAFIQNPAQWHLLAGQAELMASAVEEVLRWTSTATHIVRTATKAVVIRGREIAVGDRVTLWNPSANRDEEIFADPDRFDVRRQPNRHLALGAGEHFCLGSILARAELRLLYSELLEHAEVVEPDGTPVRLGSIVVNGLESLPVRMIAKRGAAPARVDHFS
jgi:cytochrome P450